MGNNQTRVEITDPETGQVFGLNAGMLVSDIRDVLMSRRRNQIMATTWDKLSEDQQRDEITMTTELAQDLVRTACEMIAAGGNEVIHALLDNFKIKEGAVTITAKGIADDQALLALNSVGKKALKIVVADAERFDQQREEMEPTPDEPEMPLDDAGDVDPDQWDSDPDFDGDQDQDEAGVDSTPHDLGRQQHADGALMKENPYPSGTDEFDQWKAGWKEANGAKKEPAAPPSIVTIQADGNAAALEGAVAEDNPHEDGSENHAAWAKGWKLAQRDIEGTIEEGRKAFADGVPFDQNPWQDGSKGAGFWEDGYREAQAASEDEPETTSEPEEGNAEPQAPEEAEQAEPEEVEEAAADTSQDAPAADAEPDAPVDSHRAGFNAFQDGHDITTNPWDAETDKVKHRIWARGWKAAQDEADGADDA